MHLPSPNICLYVSSNHESTLTHVILTKLKSLGSLLPFNICQFFQVMGNTLPRPSADLSARLLAFLWLLTTSSTSLVTASVVSLPPAWPLALPPLFVSLSPSPMSPGCSLPRSPPHPCCFLSYRGSTLHRASHTDPQFKLQRYLIRQKAWQNRASLSFLSLLFQISSA